MDPVKAVSHDPRAIAWDGVEFNVPWNWELGLYKFLRKGVSRIEIEDEYSVRLETEWIRPSKRGFNRDVVLKRYQEAAEQFSRKASETAAITGLPPGWTANRFVLKEMVPSKKKRGLELAESEHICALYLCPRGTLLMFVLLHFLPDDREKPLKVMTMIAESFRHHTDERLIPWKLYDIAFELPRDFLLESTLFDVGSKLMIFRWKTRRLYLWHFSCADMFLKSGVVQEDWVTGYLNGCALIRGPVFIPGKNGGVLWKRYWKHPFGHRDEIGRLCFKYKIHCRRDMVKNQLIVWVFHHRKPEDLEMIPADLLA